MIFQYYPTVDHACLYELNKDFHLSAAHFIDTEKAGKCQNVHGHTYVINLTIVGDSLNKETGFLVNFKDIKRIVHDEFDHTILNESIYFDYNNQPSTEVVAETVWEMVQTYLDTLPNSPYCVQVIVRETPTSYVRYVPNGHA